MKYRALKFLFVFVLGAVMVTQPNCIFFDSRTSLPGGLEYQEVLKIPNERDIERKALFNSYPIQTQIDIYLFAMIHRSPADVAFREYLIEDGRDKVSKLLEAIESKTSPTAKYHLIGAVWLIDRDCNCVTNDSAVLNRLKRAESHPEPSDDKGDWLAKKGYSWTLFELQRKSPEKRDNAEIQRMPNPYSNSNTN